MTRVQSRDEALCVATPECALNPAIQAHVLSAIYKNNRVMPFVYFKHNTNFAEQIEFLYIIRYDDLLNTATGMGYFDLQHIPERVALAKQDAIKWPRNTKWPPFVTIDWNCLSKRVPDRAWQISPLQNHCTVRRRVALHTIEDVLTLVPACQRRCIERLLHPTDALSKVELEFAFAALLDNGMQPQAILDKYVQRMRDKHRDSDDATAFQRMQGAHALLTKLVTYVRTTARPYASHASHLIPGSAPSGECISIRKYAGMCPYDDKENNTTTAAAAPNEAHHECMRDMEDLYATARHVIKAPSQQHHNMPRITQPIEFSQHIARVVYHIL